MNNLNEKIAKTLRHHNEVVVGAHNFGASYVPTEINDETGDAIKALITTEVEAFASKLKLPPEAEPIRVPYGNFVEGWNSYHREAKVAVDVALSRYRKGEQDA